MGMTLDLFQLALAIGLFAGVLALGGALIEWLES